MFVDAVAALEVESKNVVKRFGPRRLDIWRQKRDEYLRVLQEGKDKRRKQWVGGVLTNRVMCMLAHACMCACAHVSSAVFRCACFMSYFCTFVLIMLMLCPILKVVSECVV